MPVWHEGSKLTFHGDADEEPGLDTGDVVVKLVQVNEEETPENGTEADSDGLNLKRKAASAYVLTAPTAAQIRRPKFERLSNDVDLVVALKISLIESLTGFSIYFKHLDDRVINVKSPLGQVFGPDTVLIVESEGMPLPHNPSKRGDLFVKVYIEFPTAAEIAALGAGKLKMLQQLLPAPMHVEPAGVDTQSEHFDFHDLKVYDATKHKARQQQSYGGSSNEAYEEGDDDEQHQQQGPGCRQM